MTAPPLDPTGADQRLRIVYCAVPDRGTGDRIARLAVEGRYAACVHAWPIRSVYWWKGKVEDGEEWALLLKSSPKKLGALFELLAREHPYEVPEILEIRVPRAHEPYVQWLLATIDPESAEPPTRPRPAGSRRARGARDRRQTRAPRRRP